MCVVPKQNNSQQQGLKMSAAERGCILLEESPYILLLLLVLLSDRNIRPSVFQTSVEKRQASRERAKGHHYSGQLTDDHAAPKNTD